MIQSTKLVLALFALLALLAGCSSNTEKEEPVEEEVIEEPVISEPEPEPEPVDPAANAATTFYFDFDEAILKSDARAALTLHAQSLRQNPRSIRLEGHADERGSREYNMALGERRANAVKDFLVLQGVSASLIETVSYGEERPIALGHNEAAWAQNRRVELVK